MSKKRHKPEEIVTKLRQVEVARHPQLDRSLDFSEATWFAELLPRQPSGFFS